jgi:hypothetical protein
MLKFDASIFGGELPVGLGVVGIAVVLPRGDFVDEAAIMLASEQLPADSIHSVKLAYGGRHEQINRGRF